MCFAEYESVISSKQELEQNPINEIEKLKMAQETTTEIIVYKFMKMYKRDVFC